MHTSQFVKYGALVKESTKDPKLALRDCERKLKKSPQDVAINLYKASLLLRQRSYDQAHQQCLKVASNVLVADDVDVVVELLRLEYMSLHALDDSANVELVKTLEKQKDCLLHVSGSLIAYEYWEAAENAAIGLHKLDSKDKQRQHVRFLTNQLYATSCRTTNPSVSTMRERLLKAMLSKAIGAASLTTTQDLRFYLQLYIEMRDWNAAVHLLDNDKLGLLSSLGKADIEFIRIKLECLSELQRWQDISTFSTFVIKGHADGADPVAELRQWRLDATVWQYLTDSLVTLKQTDEAFDYSEHIRTLVPDLDLHSSSSRVMWISRLRFASNTLGTSSKVDMKALISTCITYLDHHQVRPYCCEDLRPYLAFLDAEANAQLLEHAQSLASSKEKGSKDWAITELNCLKLQFFLSVSKALIPQSELVSSYANNALRFLVALKAIKVTDESILEEGFLLACAAVEKAIEIATNDAEISKLTLQAIAILEHALSSNNAPNSYRARLRLVKIYQRTACVSLAIQHYQALRVREIQHDTISHLLYHRISLLHPSTTDTSEQRRCQLRPSLASPAKALEDIIDWYDVAIERTNDFISGQTDGLRYDKVQEFDQLKDRLQRSLYRQIATLERRKIARLTDRPYDETDTKIDFLNTVWVKDVADSRDFSRYTSFRAASGSEWEAQDTADKQSALYHTAAMTEMDATQSLLTVKDPIVEHSNSLVRLVHASDVLAASERSASLSTTWEQKTYDVVRTLRPLVLASVLGDRAESMKTLRTPTEKEIRAIISQAMEFVVTLEPPAKNLSDKDWQLPNEDTVCTIVSQLDCLKTLMKLADSLASSSKQKAHVLFKKVEAETVAQLKKEAITKANAFQAAIQDWRSYLKSKWRSILDPTAQVEGVETGSDLHAELRNIVNQGYYANTLGPKLRDSMMETLDAVLKIKIA